MKKSILCLIFSFFFSELANAHQVTHYATVFLGPFNASNADFSFSLSPQSYLIKTNIKTINFFGTVYPFTAQYKTTGNIDDNIFKTTSYQSDSKSRFNTRKKEMFYDENGRPTYRISNKNSSSKKTEILPPPDNVHTTDLQTVLAEVISQYTNFGFCNGRFHVFDGKKSFDIVFNDEGNENIEKNEYSPYHGKAVKCSFYADKLGQDLDDLVFQMTLENPVYVWILQDKKTHQPFIAKLVKNSTPLGKLEVYTKNIKIKE